MAGTTATTSTLQEVLKRAYTPWINVALNNKWLVIKRIQKNSKKIQLNEGGLYFNVNYGRPDVRAGTEAGALPDHDIADYKQVTESVTHQYGRLKWTDWLFKQGTKKTAFITRVQELMDSTIKAMIADVSRQVMGPGFGKITELSAASDGVNPTLNVDNAAAFEVGMRIDVVDSGYSSRLTSGSYLEVTGRDLDDGKVYTTGGTTASTGVDDLVIKYGVNASATSSDETVSMQQICSDTDTLHSLNPSTYRWWKAHSVANDSVIAELNLAKLHKLIDNIVMDSGETPTVMYMPFGVKRAIVRQLKDEIRFVNKLDLDGGGKIAGFTTEHGVIPMIADRFAPENTILVSNERYLHWNDLGGGGPHWFEVSGNIVFPVSGYAMMESVLIWNPQLICTLRNTMGRLTNIEHED